MSEHLQQIKTFYEKSFQTLDGGRDVPEIEVRFYPYIGINHTIRVRSGKVFVRLAEVCRDMPLSAQKALACILVSKLLRKKIPQKTLEAYRLSVKNQELREKVSENKRARGRKIITTAKGEVYDLDEIFNHLNQMYFDNKIAKPTLTWSARKTYRILGHHDSTHETIAVSCSLDNKKTPKYVVEFVVFHEMLHIFHPTTYRNGRGYNHTPQFRRDEKQFLHFDKAENWIGRNVKNLKRKTKSKKQKGET
ncbi:MAG: SprT-like domain-containing protein [Acidobacteriota bacterium]|nr:SprT-like domain-containing protein [Acidobacteriota bacterium]